MSPGSAPLLRVSGGIVAQKVVQPLLFTWQSSVTVTGDGFEPSEAVSVSLFGPTNSIGVAPAALPIGGASADASGHLSVALTIPYDGGVSGPSAQIPRPGLYQVRASSRRAGTVAASDAISLAPQTDSKIIDWGHERGSRPGNLPGQFADMSPERIDPEWISVWDERPVGAYGTCDDSHSSASDYPGTHYSHDFCFGLKPDPEYRWLIGTHNYDEDGDIVEVEWETLNGGTPYANGTGQIGLPLWAQPTDGDRVYVVGRWILDVGHPDGGSGTEIHPPRLLASMRQRPTLNAAGSQAAQVDVYVSGHGGGANRFADGLSAALGFANGRGGGRIQDLGAATAALYYQAGPATTVEKAALIPVGFAAGLSAADLTTYLANVAALTSSAGPSAFGWVQNPSEERRIDDMDYEFDVPLPPQPAGATAPVIEVVRHLEDSGSVNEVITYADFPRSVHVKLPYAGKGGGVYARTIKIASSAPPAKHYRVRLVEIDAIDLPGYWHMTADVSGQWVDVARLNPAFAQVAQGQVVSVGADFDVYLGPQDSLWVHVMGYRPAPIDALFGKMFGLSSYSQLLSIAANAAITSTRDSDNLGEALLEIKPPLPASASTFTVDAMDGTNPGHFKVVLVVEPK